MTKSQRRKYIYQASVQIIANFSILTISFLINMIASKKISPNDYGEYRYIVNYSLLIPGLINFGYSHSVGRLAAIRGEPEQGQISGYSLKISLTLSLGYVFLSMFVLSMLKLLGNLSLSWKVIFFTPYIIITTVNLFFRAVLVGQNKIFSLSLVDLVPQLVFLIIIAIQIYIFDFSSTFTLLIPYVITHSFTVLYRVYRNKPSRVTIKESFSFLKDENRRFGIKVYFGSLFGVAIGQLAGLIIGGIVGMQEYGFFTFAFSFVVPFQMLASTLGTVLYRSNVTRKKLGFKLFGFVIASNSLAYLLFSVLIGVLFERIFSIDYIESLPYMRILAIYGICLGIGDFINRFLGAKGYGKTLMLGAVFAGLSMLLGTAILVPIFQIMGLVFSYIISGLTYLFCMLVGYYKYVLNHEWSEAK
ncbi:oligosaccharide flippase family protein [Mesotoga sp.]|uniref:lipopolysaccharide biosynthesis protein n=1 Tax=Mesotoga sp. TaxID=2053577 RepID=UPI002628FBC5|nr:oligosaccharide flippase family protein [Mesotoga sp.]